MALERDPQSDAAGFEGLWSNYPFFESGIVIGSDVQSGLFVWWMGDPLLSFDYPEGRPRVLDPSGHSLHVVIGQNGDEFVPTCCSCCLVERGAMMSRSIPVSRGSVK